MSNIPIDEQTKKAKAHKRFLWNQIGMAIKFNDLFIDEIVIGGQTRDLPENAEINIRIIGSIKNMKMRKSRGK